MKKGDRIATLLCGFSLNDSTGEAVQIFYSEESLSQRRLKSTEVLDLT